MKVAAELAGISRGPVRAQSGLSSLGDRSVGTAFSACSRTVDDFAENIAQLSPDRAPARDALSRRHGGLGGLGRRRFNTTIDVIREMNDLPTGRLTVGAISRAGAGRCCHRRCARGRAFRSPERRPPRHACPCRAARRLALGDRAAPGMNVNKLANLNGMQPDDPLRAGQRSELSSGGSESSQAARRPVTYTVRSGDTLRRSHDSFRCRSRRLRWNGLSRRASSPGRSFSSGLESPRLKPQGPFFPLDSTGGLAMGFLRQTRTHRGRCDRTFDRLGHRAGHASRRCGTRVLLRQRQIEGTGRAAGATLGSA